MRKLVGLVLLTVLGPAVAGETGTRIGRAVSLESEMPLYAEHHEETREGEKVVSATVRYVDAEGVAFARKRIDFVPDRFLPTFAFENTRSGHVASLTRNEQGVKLRYRESASVEVTETTVDVPPDAIGDAGFDRFITANWDELVSGATLVRPFLVPSRQTFVRFAIASVEASSDVIRFEITPESWLLKLVVPVLSVEYDAQRRRLLSYEGLSNVRDDSGEPYLVRIRFTYPAK